MSMVLTTALTDLVRESLGDPQAEIADQHVEPLDLSPGTVSTGSLHRVHGTTTGGATWSFFVKSIHSARHWAGYAAVPEHLREGLDAQFPWRADADVYLASPPLPAGLRLPRLYRLDDLGDDRLVMWLEDVRLAPAEWDLDTYRRAARLLGELSAACPLAERSAGPREPLNLAFHYYRAGPLDNLFLPALRDPATWRHPLVAAHADPLLRADLLALAERIDPMLEALDRLPHTLVHGDASPWNLLIPADGSVEFVAIDWSWPYPAAVGFDLGQLLVGRAHTGELDPADLPAVHKTIETAYAASVADIADPAEVSFGYVTSLVLRSAWTAIPIELLDRAPTPQLDELFRKRAGLARFLADLGRSLPLPGSGEGRDQAGHREEGGAGTGSGVREQAADHCAEEPADAEDRVERGHQGPSPGAFHLDGVRVHGDVQRAVHGSEREQRGGQGDDPVGVGGRHEGHGLQERHGDCDGGTAVAVHEPADDLHAHDGAGGEAEQREPEPAVAEPETVACRSAPSSDHRARPGGLHGAASPNRWETSAADRSRDGRARCRGGVRDI